MQGQFDPEYEPIMKSVSAILFMSTPHRGTNLAETLNRILQVSFVSTPRQYINDLVKNSSTIQKINEQFRHLAPKLSIVSFYETQPTAIGFAGPNIVSSSLVLDSRSKSDIERLDGFGERLFSSGLSGRSF